MPSSTPRKKPQGPRPHPLHDMDAFDAMMERARRKVLASPAAARAALVRSGIYTKSGKLTKPYR